MTIKDLTHNYVTDTQNTKSKVRDSKTSINEFDCVSCSAEINEGVEGIARWN